MNDELVNKYRANRTIDPCRANAPDPLTMFIVVEDADTSTGEDAVFEDDVIQAVTDGIISVIGLDDDKAQFDLYNWSDTGVRKIVKHAGSQDFDNLDADDALHVVCRYGSAVVMVFAPIPDSAQHEVLRGLPVDGLVLERREIVYPKHGMLNLTVDDSLSMSDSVMLAQVGHAVQYAILCLSPSDYEAWFDSGFAVSLNHGRVNPMSKIRVKTKGIQSIPDGSFIVTGHYLV